MKKWLTAMLLVMCANAWAQNNPIFGGGTADGYNRSGYAQNVNDIFTGGSGDGWNYRGYTQTVNNIFSGGIGDGWTVKAYTQTVNNIYNGGIGDGWSFSLYQQPVNNIYPGGNGDGWHFKNYQQQSNNVFPGGIGDGWASTYRPLGVLPVTFISFTAQKQNQTSLLKWETAKEINTASFDVERSNNAVNFTKVGGVVATGNSSTPTQYSFVDKVPAKGYNYYRLKQLDRNGVFVYTPTRLLLFDGAGYQSIKVYPVPAAALVTVELPAQIRNEEVLVNLSNSIGVMVQHIRVPRNRIDDKRVLNISTLPAGVYTLQVSSASFNGSQKIVKQ